MKPDAPALPSSPKNSFGVPHLSKNKADTLETDDEEKNIPTRYYYWNRHFWLQQGSSHLDFEVPKFHSCRIRPCTLKKAKIVNCQWIIRHSTTVRIKHNQNGPSRSWLMNKTCHATVLYDAILFERIVSQTKDVSAIICLGQSSTASGIGRKNAKSHHCYWNSHLLFELMDNPSTYLKSMRIQEPTHNF